MVAQPIRRAALFLSVCCALACWLGHASTALGWSTKEHILLTRLASIRLLDSPETPAAMKAWLREAMPRLGPDVASQREYLLHARVGPFPRDVDSIAFWVVVPDLNAMTDSSAPAERVRKVEPFGVGERLLHFIDLELFMPEEAARRYRPDLSSKPNASDLPRDRTDARYQRAGMLPFRVEQCYQDLVASIRKGRLVDKPGQLPRDEHASKWAGFLAHYVQDNTQPHHSTVDYRSASYFGATPRDAPNVHADIEYRLVDDELEDYPELRKEFWELLVKALRDGHDPVRSDDPFDATVEVALRSYDALPLIGEAAVAAYGNPPDQQKPFDADSFFHFKGNVNGRAMSVLEIKAQQMAWAVRRTERLWLQAWREAMREVRPRE
jgi:hypothetical protein